MQATFIAVKAAAFATEYIQQHPEVQENTVIEAFTAGANVANTLEDAGDFGQAVKALAAGHKIRRATWSYCYLSMREQCIVRTEMTPECTFKSEDFAPSVEDMLAEDWQIVKMC